MSISPSVKTNRLGQSSEIPHGGQSGVSADRIYNAESSQRVVHLEGAVQLQGLMDIILYSQEVVNMC